MKDFTLLRSTRYCCRVCWHWLVTSGKKIKAKPGLLVLSLLLFLMAAGPARAQVDIPLTDEIKANFGVEADVYTNVNEIIDNALYDGTDDWFQDLDQWPGSGEGVIDVSSAAALSLISQWEVDEDDNIGGELRQSIPIYTTTLDGRIWIDAVYGRDQRTNGKLTDMSFFTAGDDKNFQDPETWTIGTGSGGPQKNDIIEFVGHLRRDNDGTINTLGTEYAIFGATTRSQNGTSHLDFELFRAPVELIGGNLVSEGTECNRTAYEFAADGSVITHGDVIFSVNYENGGDNVKVELYIWIDRTDFPNVTAFQAFNALLSNPFDFGSASGDFNFYECNTDPNYGYAQVSLVSALSEDWVTAQINQAPVTGPPWGTYNSKGDLVDDFPTLAFIEISLDATALGLDTGTTSGSCQNPLGSVIVKTRSSASFTAELKDLSGPYQLGDTPEVDVTLADQALNCTLEFVTLQADVLQEGTYKYEWFIKDGEDFVKLEGIPEDQDELQVSEPGIYKVRVTRIFGDGSEGCFDEDEATVTGTNDAPELVTTCPEADTVSCTEDINSAFTTWLNTFDVTGGGGTVTSTYTVIIDGGTESAPIDFANWPQGIVEPDDVCGGGSITITLNAEDECTQSDSCSSTFTLNPITPGLDLPQNGSETVACASDATDPGAPATIQDACGNDVVPVMIGSVSNPDPITCEGTVVWTYRYTECNESTSDWTYTYIIEYNELVEPTATTDEVSCYDDIVLPDPLPIVFDSCGESLTPTGPVESPVPGCEGEVSYTWTYTDCTQSSVDYVHTVTIEYDPLAAITPTDDEVACYDDIVLPTPPTVLDSCDEEITPSGPVESLVPECEGDVSYTWTYTDCAGSSVDYVHTVTIDYDPLAAITPTDDEVACYDDIVLPTPPTVLDSCDEEITPSGPVESLVPECEGDVSYTWTYTDCAGSSVDYVHTVTIDYDPLAAITPTDDEVACYDDIVLPTPPTVLDSCDEEITPSGPVESLVPECEGDVSYTWTYTDCAGSSVDYVHTVTIDYDPLAAITPTDDEVACYDDIVLPTPPTVLDSCDEEITPSGPVESLVPECEGDVSYTWTYTDCAGSSVDYVHTVTIDYDPLAAITPTDDEVACYDDIVLPTPPTVLDSCDEEITPSGPVESLVPECEGDVSYTWTYTDCAGSSVDYVHTVTIDYDPLAAITPTDDEVACYDDIVLPTPPTVLDSCDEEITPSGPVESLVPECEGDVSYTWTYTDCAGSSVDYVHTVTIDYDPLAAITPTDDEVACYDDIVLPTPPTVLDSCDEEITPSGPVESLVPECEGDVSYTWTYTDCAGSSVDYVHTVTIDYDPLAAITPTDDEVACYDDIVLPTPPTVLDSCDEEITPSGPVESLVPECEGDVSYTWTYTDCAGSSVDYVHTVTIDYDPLAAITPTDDEVACYDDIVLPTPPTVLDSCDEEITPSGPVESLVPECEGDVSYTWTYTDCAGSSVDYVHTVTIDYDPLAAITPTDDEVACYDDIVLPTPPTVLDSCDEEITPSGPVESLVPECEGDVSYTWTYTDCAGSSVDYVHTVTIDYDPLAAITPTDDEVACYDDIVLPTPPTVLDSCDEEITPSGPVESLVPECEGDVSYTWTYTDCAGSSVDYVHTVTIDYDPLAAITPTDDEVACYDDIVLPTPPTVLDSCDEEITPSGPVESLVPECEGDVSYTWTYTDCAGSSVDYVHTVTIDYDPLAAITPTDDEVACYDDIVLPTPPTVLDSCDEEITPSGPVESLVPECEGDVSYTWTYTDCAGSSVDYVHTVTIDYDPLAAITPTDDEVACYDDIVLPTPPTVLDSCDEEITPSGPVESLVPECEGDVSYTWTYTDCAGSSVDYVHTVTIDYDPLAAITPTDDEVACYDDIVLPTPPTVLDSCDEEITPSGPVESLVPECEGDVSYTWTYTDCAGSSVDYVHTVTIDYSGGLTAPDDDEMDVQCPDDVVMPDSPGNITDACGRTVEPVFTGRQGNPEEITCKGTVIYTWTYTACDGETTDTYTYTYNVEDTENPLIEIPQVEDVCEDDVPASLTAYWTDNCADGGSLDASPVLVGSDECSNTYRYTWTVADDCGNTDTAYVDIVQEFDVVGNCETVFGYYDNEVSQCFITDNSVDFNRWGWTNELTAEGSYELTLYAGAGQCDRSKGAEAGTATIDYFGDEVTVTYQMNGYTLTEAHVYIGCTPYPIKNGSETVAPGQYNFNPELGENVQAYQVGPIDVSDLDDVYVIVHGVACEIVCQCTPDANGEIPSAFDGASATCDESQTASNGNGNGNGKNNKAAESSFSASPVPFNDKLTLKYDFEYTSNKVDIQVYDLSGRLLRTYSDKKVKGGDTKELNIDFALKANQVYIIRMVTDREVLTKNVISSSRK